MQQELWIGIIASVCTGISLLPQLFKIYRDKECNVSILMLVILFCGNVFWVWYGNLKKDAIIIVSNSFSVLINVSLSFLWLRYRTGKKKKA